MIIDSSAVVAILKDEPDAGVYTEAIGRAEQNRMSAASWLETAIVVDASRDARLSRGFDALIEDASVDIVAVSHEQARLARAAYRDFGKGSGHPARLNFGDCFAYALAQSLREPLLYKGGDFAHTGIRSALARR